MRSISVQLCSMEKENAELEEELTRLQDLVEELQAALQGAADTNPVHIRMCWDFAELEEVHIRMCQDFAELEGAHNRAVWDFEELEGTLAASQERVLNLTAELTKLRAKVPWPASKARYEKVCEAFPLLERRVADVEMLVAVDAELSRVQVKQEPGSD